ncbi:MAG: glycosyltransferase family 2 protein [Candidatus Pacebacteria bacterium]|nr:glycosyltransferase family 2 protein [Candidatus Paceibacterota bacterium]
MTHPFLSIIIPAYNEAKRLPMTLIDIDKHLKDQDFTYEIIVVNDGSKDETADVVNRFLSLIDHLKLIDNKHNSGKGAVVRQGMLEAKGKWRLFMDADNSTSIVEFNKMIPYFQNYQVVIADRDLKESRLIPPQPWYKRVLGNFGNLIIQILLLPGIWDTQCGFKCFSEEAVQKIFSVSKIDRWGFDVEALALAKKLGYKIKRIPIFWVNDIRSHVKLSAYLEVFKEVFKIRWWLWKGDYKLNK